MSLLAWFWTSYFVLGILVLVKPFIEAWSMSRDHWGIKVGGAILALLIWPAAFFMNANK